MRPDRERLAITVASPGTDSDSAVIQSYGYFDYIEVQHPGVGDPDYSIQIVNERGTVIWDSGTTFTGDIVVHINEKIPCFLNRVRLVGPTLAGSYLAFVHSGD